MSPKQKFITALKNRHLINVDEVAPFLLASVGSHVANLRQNRIVLRYNLQGPIAVPSITLQPIYQGANGTDLRCHLLIIGKPASGKSIFGKQMFDDEIGLLHTAIPNTSMGKITEAGLVGQKKIINKGGEYAWEFGLLKSKSDNILFFSEFSNLTDSMKTMHSNNLLNTMLDALSGGNVAVTMGGVDERFDTNVTVMGCIQPLRFERITGMDRRFVFFNNPEINGDLMNKYKEAALSSPLQVDVVELEDVRSAFRKRFMEIGNIKEIKLSEELKNYFVKERKVTAQLIGILVNFVIGDYLMSAETLGENIVVPLTDDLKKLVSSAINYWAQSVTDMNIYEMVLTNDLPATRLYGVITKERKCSASTAEKSVRKCIEHYDSRGFRYVICKNPGMGPPLKIPTGLTVKELQERGFDVLREELYDGMIYHVGEYEEEQPYDTEEEEEIQEENYYV